jgi:hypothetical protein
VISFKRTVSRSSPNPKTRGEASDYHVYVQEPPVDGKPNCQRQNLARMLVNGTCDMALIPNIFPKFLKVSNHGTPITQLMNPIGLRYNNISVGVFIVRGACIVRSYCIATYFILQVIFSILSAC